MAYADIVESIGPYEFHHPKNFPAVTEDPFHLVDFLKASTKAGSLSSAIDIGCSTGVIPLLLAANTNLMHITGVEIDDDSARSAIENVERNGLGEKIEIIKMDYRDLPKEALYDIVVSNPPYIKMGSGRKSGNEKRKIARYEEIGNLKELIKVSKRLLSEAGSLFLIFPMIRQAELMGVLSEVDMTPLRVKDLYFDESKGTFKRFMIEVERKSHREEG
ncbi:MAG: methyltransferase [Thermodesulfobacteriota bacterium]